MEGSKASYIDSTSQLFSAGLTIRQKEPKNLEAPFDRIDSILRRRNCFISAVIFRYQPWTARPTGCASMVLSGIRLR
jgi:hypothetical protein